jgi:hypothetical protein
MKRDKVSDIIYILKISIEIILMSINKEDQKRHFEYLETELKNQNSRLASIEETLKNQFNENNVGFISSLFC